MTKDDRELLIRIDEGMKHLRNSHDEHKEQTEEKLTAIQSEQIAQGKQIATLKEKNKPFLFKLFAAIFAAKGGLIMNERNNTDMSSDNWLSKSARPTILLYSWLLVTVIYVFDIFGYKTSPEVTTMIEYLCITVNAAYFGSRSVEKITQMRSPRK